MFAAASFVFGEPDASERNSFASLTEPSQIVEEVRPRAPSRRRNRSLDSLLMWTSRYQPLTHVGDAERDVHPDACRNQHHRASPSSWLTRRQTVSGSVPTSKRTRRPPMSSTSIPGADRSTITGAGLGIDCGTSAD